MRIYWYYSGPILSHMSLYVTLQSFKFIDKLLDKVTSAHMCIAPNLLMRRFAAMSRLAYEQMQLHCVRTRFEQPAPFVFHVRKIWDCFRIFEAPTVGWYGRFATRFTMQKRTNSITQPRHRRWLDTITRDDRRRSKGKIALEGGTRTPDEGSRCNKMSQTVTNGAAAVALLCHSSYSTL